MIAVEVSGVAAGPYPGTFVESGTMTIGPQDIPEQQFGVPNAVGLVVSVDLDFAITSGSTLITGTKSFNSLVMWALQRPR